MNLEMSMALELVKEAEGFGYGRNLEVHPLSEEEKAELASDGSVSEEVAERWAIKELYECEEKLKSNIIYQKQSDTRKAVLLDMCFNIGYGGLMKFKKMWFALGNREFTQVSNEMKASAWYDQVGLRSKRNCLMMAKDSVFSYGDIE